MSKKMNRKIAMMASILLVWQQIPAMTLSTFAADIVTEHQGGLTATIQWAIVNDNGTKILRLWGTGTLPNQSAGNQPWVSYATDCTKLEIGEGITSIGANAFKNSIPSVTDISIPNSVTSIYAGAFGGCAATELNLSANITSISGGCNNAFCDMFNIERFNVDAANSRFKSVDGVIYSKDGKYLVSYPHERKDTYYVIPDSCTIVSANAFWDNDYLQTVSGSGVTTIDIYGFYNCTALRRFDFPKLTSINSFGFSDCTSLERAVSFVSTNSNAYNNCSSISEIILGKGCPLTNFGGIFTGTRSTELITITVENDLFDKVLLNNLVNLFSNVTTIKGHANSPASQLAADRSLTFIELPYEELSGKIGENVTYDFNTSTKVLTISGTGATYNYSSVDSPLCQFGEYSEIIIEDGITSLGANVLMDVRFTSANGALKYPDSLESTGSNVFRTLYNCGTWTISKKLSSMSTAPLFYNVRPNIIVSAGSMNFSLVDGMLIYISGASQYVMFSDNTLPSDVTIPEGVTVISSGPFRGASVKNMQLPSTLTSIYTSGVDLMQQCETLDFSKCTKLTTINTNNFRNMYKLKRLDLSNTKVSKIGTGTIINCTELEVLKLPGTIKSTSTEMLTGCPNIKEFWCPSTSILQLGTLPCVVFAKPGSALWRNAEAKNNALIDYDAGLAGTYKYSDNLKQAVSYNSTTKTLYVTGTGTVDLSQFIPTIKTANSGSLDIDTIEVSKTVSGITNVSAIVADNAQIFIYAATGTFTDLVSSPYVTVFGFRGSDVETHCTNNDITFYPLQSCGDGVYWYVENETLYIIGQGAVSSYSAGTAPWSAAYDNSQIKHVSLARGVTDIPTATLALLPYSSEITGYAKRNVADGLAAKIVASGHHYIDIENAVSYGEKADIIAAEGATWWSLEKDPANSAKYNLYMQKRLTAAQLQGISTYANDGSDAYCLTAADKAAVNAAAGAHQYSAVFTDGCSTIADDGLSNLSGLSGTISGIAVYGSNAVANTAVSAVDWTPVIDIGAGAFAHTAIQEVILNNVVSVGSKAFEKSGSELALVTIVSSSNSTAYAADAFATAIADGTKIYDVTYKGALSSNIATLDPSKHVYTRNATITAVDPDVALTAHTAKTVQWYYSGENPNNVTIEYNGSALSTTNKGAADDKRGFILETTITPVTSGEVPVVCSATASAPYVFAVGENTIILNSGKATPTLESISTTAITYKQTLADSVISGEMKYGGVTVPGTFTWKEPDTVPEATDITSTGYTVVFTPDVTADYNSVEIPGVQVTVNPATPVLSDLSATGITYLQSLADSTITGTAKYAGETVLGTFQWAQSAITPAVLDSNTTAYNVVFTPTDTRNYTNANSTVTLSVAQADVPITQDMIDSITTTDITYFDTLEDSIITGDMPIDVLGTYSWETVSIAPSVLDSDVTLYSIIFTPNDTTNYKVYTGIEAKVHVDKYQIVLDDTTKAGVTATALTYEQTLGESTLSGPKVYNADGIEITGSYVWTAPDTVPNVGTGSTSAYGVKFVPDDTTNIIESEEFPVSVTVNKTSMTELPEIYKTTLRASGITYGQTLADSDITGNKPYAGHYEWVTDTTVPEVADSNTTGYAVRFVPDDTNNYPTLDCGTLTLAVTPYVITLTDAQKSAVSATSIMYEDTLGESTLTGPVLKNLHDDTIAGQYVWVNADTTPSATKDTAEKFAVKFVPTNTSNYVESAAFDVAITVAKRAYPTLPEPYLVTLQASELTYGNTLNDSSITGDKPYAGEYVWVAPETRPDVTDSNNTQYAVKFVPTDTDNYEEITGIELKVAVNPYKVVLTDAEKNSISATTITYGQSIAESGIYGPSLKDLANADIAGSYVWVDNTAKPNTGTTAYSARFVPTDTLRYTASDTFDVDVTVVKAEIPLPPEIESTLRTTAITYGQPLSASEITGDTPVAGHYEWEDVAIIPTVSASDSTEFLAKFIPDDTLNYAIISGIKLKVTVNPYQIVLTDAEKAAVSATIITKGDTLADSTLTGSALHSIYLGEIAGRYAWVDSTVAPAVGTASYAVQFMPTDNVNYLASAPFDVSVTTRKSSGGNTPVRPVRPVHPDVPDEKYEVYATDIVYGQTLADSKLSGKAPCAGHFEWVDSTLKPTVADSEKTEYYVKFVPDDKLKYSEVTGLKVKLTVKPYEIDVASVKYDTITAVVGQTVADCEVAYKQPVDINDMAIEGTWTWIEPTMCFTEERVYATGLVFTPVDTQNYVTRGNASIQIDTRTNSVDVSGIVVTASAIMVSQTLGNSEIIAESPIKGEWRWVDAGQRFDIPGSYEVKAYFVPESSAYKASAPVTVMVQVDKYAIDCAKYTVSAETLEVGQMLRDCVISGEQVLDDAENQVEGTWQWLRADTTFDEKGDYEVEAVFVPSNQECYSVKNTATATVTVVLGSKPEDTGDDVTAEESQNPSDDVNDDTSTGTSEAGNENTQNPHTGIQNLVEKAAVFAAVLSVTGMLITWLLRRRRR